MSIFMEDVCGRGEGKRSEKENGVDTYWIWEGRCLRYNYILEKLELINYSLRFRKVVWKRKDKEKRRMMISGGLTGNGMIHNKRCGERVPNVVWLLLCQTQVSHDPAHKG
ncbi:unnamed protein product [Allacma fusca]|uniref:Uncharacterized protein n=1 Tax=Allacma fusca TaxID=39272 RepID=A0A8J2JTF3_9HEXA|nr:unnamed protein product [Allacma fusca]